MAFQISLKMNKMRSPLKKVTNEERIKATWISAVQDIFPRSSLWSFCDLIRDIRKDLNDQNSMMSRSHSHDSRNESSVHYGVLLLGTITMSGSKNRVRLTT